jgi:hypothetical protein
MTYIFNSRSWQKHAPSFYSSKKCICVSVQADQDTVATHSKLPSVHTHHKEVVHTPSFTQASSAYYPLYYPSNQYLRADLDYSRDLLLTLIHHTNNEASECNDGLYSVLVIV